MKIESQARDLAAAREYATTLARAMWEKYYADTAPEWEPLDDLLGLLTQIDNMVAGIDAAKEQDAG